ncbi:putative F-box protein At3g10430 isoform X3 [Mercurialis annua]|uniref:putative F-box protein At3g10430 isoform X3 n=1 Tax=Mercurialis annua TaxID=3986 RepID=UPI00215EAC19|nr:putative F-box protein At3g10430 isoform X3 [Mercurialis annua]
MSIPSDLVGEILVRLPLDSLMRFRRVCKTWQFMITNDPQIVHRCNELREIESKEAIRFQKEMQKMIDSRYFIARRRRRKVALHKVFEEMA